jgi:hypothetical protein
MISKSRRHFLPVCPEMFRIGWRPSRFVISFLSLALLLATVAQGAESVDHSVHFPKVPAAWSVAFELLGKPERAAPKSPSENPRPAQISAIEVTQGPTLRRDKIRYGEEVLERWWVSSPSFVLWEEAAGQVHVSKAGNMQSERYDGTFFTWVNANTFKGMSDFKNIKCRYYEYDVKKMEEWTRYCAWINNETGQPVAWSNSGRVAVFAFNAETPTEELVLPEKYKERLAGLMRFFAPPKKPNGR